VGSCSAANRGWGVAFYEDAFGLKDNPFEPNNGYPGAARRYTQMLSTKPLELYREPKLRDLYVPDAGPFKHHLESFKRKFIEAGYEAEQKAGSRPFIFLISGPAGSGKTTLVNDMIAWLTSCPLDPGAAWCVAPETPPPLAYGPDQQKELFPKIREEVNKRAGPNDYIILVLDDLIEEGAHNAALQLWDELAPQWPTRILFMLAKQSWLAGSSLDDSRYDILPFTMRPVTPDEAVAFATARFSRFRDGPTPTWAAKYPIFPFDVEAISDDVRSGKLGSGATPGSITLRTLGRVLARGMSDRVGEYIDGKRTRPFAALTEAEAATDLIAPTDAYRAAMAS
jgi:hypothetical protein